MITADFLMDCDWSHASIKYIKADQKNHSLSASSIKSQFKLWLPLILWWTVIMSLSSSKYIKQIKRIRAHQR